MSLQFVLPPALEHELQSEAERDGLSIEEYVLLILGLSSTLLKDEGDTPLHRAVNDFLAKRSVDAVQVSHALRDLLRLAADREPLTPRWSSKESRNTPADAVSILERTLGASATSQRASRISAYGMCAHLSGGSVEFAREKHAELAREEER